MLLDFTVNLGHVLTIASFLIGGVAFVYAIRGDVGSIKARMEVVESEIRKISDILITVARQDERMNAFDRQITELKDLLKGKTIA